MCQEHFYHSWLRGRMALHPAILSENIMEERRLDSISKGQGPLLVVLFVGDIVSAET